MPTIEYLVKPQGKVLGEYYRSMARVNIIIGPLGSGKTITTINKIFDLMCRQEPTAEGIRLSRWVAVRNTYSDLMNTTIKDWRECHDDLGVFTMGSKEPPKQVLEFQLEDGTVVKSEILFIAFDRPDDVKKARGLQITGVWGNELKELAKPVWDMLDLRHGRYPSRKEGVLPTWHGMLGDSNAPDDDHWLYRLAEEDKPEDWEFFKQPGGVVWVNGKWEENPDAENINNLPEFYYARGLQGKSNAWIKVNLANEYGFVSDGRPVHPFYTDSVHCKEMSFTPDKSHPIILGFDFGRTPAAAFLQQRAGQWICFDEFVTVNMSASSFAPELKRYMDEVYPHHKWRGWADPAGGKAGETVDYTSIDVLNRHGIPAQPCHTNKALTRRSAMENPLKELNMEGQPRFIILPKAKWIRKGLAGGFKFKRLQVSGDERYTDEPDKNDYSHPVEACEYALMGEGESRGRSEMANPFMQPVTIEPFDVFG